MSDTTTTPPINTNALAVDAAPRLRLASKALYAEARTVADAPYARMRAGNSYSSPGEMHAAIDYAGDEARRIRAAAFGFERSADYAEKGSLYANAPMRNSSKWAEFADLHKYFREFN